MLFSYSKGNKVIYVFSTNEGHAAIQEYASRSNFSRTAKIGSLTIIDAQPDRGANLITLLAKSGNTLWRASWYGYDTEVVFIQLPGDNPLYAISRATGRL